MSHLNTHTEREREGLVTLCSSLCCEIKNRGYFYTTFNYEQELCHEFNGFVVVISSVNWAPLSSVYVCVERE